jgi:preprotein translocase subunit SecD
LSKRVRWRVLLILVVLIGSVAGFLLTGYRNAQKDWIGEGKPPLKDAAKHAIRLGLDLRGGIHLVLQVQTADALKAERDEAAERFTAELRKQGLAPTAAPPPSDTSFAVGIPAGSDESKINDAARRMLGTDWTHSAAGGTWTFRLTDMARRSIADTAASQALETIRNRIDEFGVSEPIIARQGEDRILVQLPGIDDPKRVKDLIKNTAFLELKLVEGGPTPNRAELEARLTPDLELLEARAEPGQRDTTYYLVRKAAVITGRDMKNARPGRGGQFGDQNHVNFFLTAAGASKFGQATEANVNRFLAIVLDGKVQSAPRINSRIDDSGVIEGAFTPEEANDLALVLRAGALPAGLTYLEERTVGPSLGADSIRKGIRASILGAVLVFIAVVLYYRNAGWNAVIALILNGILLAAALSIFGATLTLPGIAGFMLTIGMAVDSNVLVFERVREELRAGRAPRTAIENGFSKAWGTIIDTHATVLLSAVFLFQFGTGPVRGFAVTLILGLVISMFTAVYVSHTIFDLVYGRRQHIDALSI